MSAKHQRKSTYDEWEEHTEPTNPATKCFGVEHSEYLVLLFSVVGEVGADPTTPVATVLQTAVFADSLLSVMVSKTGVEPVRSV